MQRYDALLAAALRSIAGTFRSAQLRELTRSRDAKLARPADRPDRAEQLELITWLVIADANDTAVDVAKAPTQGAAAADG